MNPEISPQSEAKFDAVVAPQLSKLDLALADKPESRQKIFEQLRTRQWFKDSSDALQLELANLPHAPKVNHDGYLRDLASRPEDISDVKVLSLQRLARGEYGLISVFNVVKEGGNPFTYEYFSWRYGPESGAKGLVLIETNGKPSHFVVLRGQKFATAKLEMDSVGGFIDLNVDGVMSAIARVKKEVQEELGLDELRLAREPVILGTQAVDPGATNNRPLLFVASIDASDAAKIGASPKNPDEFELKAGANIYPMSELRQVVLGDIDTFFGISLLKAWAHGIIDLS